MKGYTQATKYKDIQRKWHLIDVKGKILGRITSQIAQILRGKQKPYFTHHLDMGDHVVVVNASQIEVSGEKREKKEYTSYSGYPGGLKKKKFNLLQKQKPEEIIKRAVSGMLPKNKLRKKWLRRLYIFKDENHPYQEKFNSKN